MLCRKSPPNAMFRFRVLQVINVVGMKMMEFMIGEDEGRISIEVRFGKVRSVNVSDDVMRIDSDLGEYAFKTNEIIECSDRWLVDIVKERMMEVIDRIAKEVR